MVTFMRGDNSVNIQVEEKFGEIRQLARGKPYERHLVSQMYAVENSIQDGDDEQVTKFISHLDKPHNFINFTNWDFWLHGISL